MEANVFSLCFSHEDMNEGVSAFLEKRKAQFK
jgi:enoyl-CoA hydratase/carnithine racemase